jgi:GNAT superfamily N-acetyltransferase
MPDYAFHIEQHPSQVDISVLEAHIYAFNVASTGHTDGQELAIFLRDADDALIGGIFGFTWDGWFDIRLFWVHEDQRGHGLGGQLLVTAEAEAIRRGCHTAIVETHSFQAPDFYQHRGFTIYTTLEGYPSGHSKHFLRKRLLA